MERALTSLEIKAMSLKVGEKVKKLLVCAICEDNPGVEYSNIDGVRFCDNKDLAKKQKKKLKQKFTKDDVRILETQVKRIE